MVAAVLQAATKLMILVVVIALLLVMLLPWCGVRRARTDRTHVKQAYTQNFAI